jgi:hypothetical protein
VDSGPARGRSSSRDAGAGARHKLSEGWDAGLSKEKLDLRAAVNLLIAVLVSRRKKIGFALLQFTRMHG